MSTELEHVPAATRVAPDDAVHVVCAGCYNGTEDYWVTLCGLLGEIEDISPKKFDCPACKRAAETHRHIR